MVVVCGGGCVVYRLISLLSGCALKAAFVSEGYFFTRTYKPPCPLLPSSSPLAFFFFFSVLSRVIVRLLRFNTLEVFHLIYWPLWFCERGKVRICANVHRRSCTYIRTGNTDGLSCCKREGKKKRAINRNSQWECWGEREALMSHWRRISVFHVERCEGRGKRYHKQNKCAA